MTNKRILALLLTMVLCVSSVSAGVTAYADDGGTSLDASAVTGLKLDVPEQQYKTEQRWWLAQGAHTAETIRESVKEMHDAGFSSIEFAMLNDTNVPAATYGYGSKDWVYCAKVLLEETTRYGMGLSFTSGTHWASANIPGLDPNSQSAGQEFRASEQYVAAGASRTGALTMPAKRGAMVTAQTPIIAGAYKLTAPYRSSGATYDNPMMLDPDSFIDLTGQMETVTNPESGAVTYNLDWTAPAPVGEDDPGYVLFFFCQQGIARSNSPAVTTSYDINYFDERGVEALKDFWNGYYFADPEFVELLEENGNTQMFLDSLEIGTSGGDFTFWSEDMANIFMERKGYDIRPYLPLFIGSSGVWVESIQVNGGKYDLGGDDGPELRRKIRNDLYDIHTALLREKMMDPLREWLNEEYGMKLRAQISYGQYMEISLPAMSVDYVESESRNMRDQSDAFRAHAGAVHLQNKLYSSETGADNDMNYFHSMQDYLQKCYAFYAGGGNRVIWHGYASILGLTKTSAPWPGYEAGMGTIAGRWSVREPAYKDYGEYNDHLGRLQTVLRAGKSRTDLGILQLSYNYWAPRRSKDPADALGLQNHHGLTWKDLTLQDNGYTYDYFAPQYLETDLVSYDPESGLISPDGPGYRALMVFEPEIPLSSAEMLLDLAKQGMKLVIVDGALTETAFYGDHLAEGEARLDEIRAELLELPNVVSAGNQAAALEALETLGISPRAGYNAPSELLISQMREDEDATYLYLWNYSGLMGTDPARTAGFDGEIVLDGTYVPYILDTWTGEISAVALYTQEDGKTVIPASIDSRDVAVYILKQADLEARHAVSVSDGEVVSRDGKYYVRALSNGEYSLTRDDERVYEVSAAGLPASRNLTGWQLDVESWDRSDTTDDSNWVTRSETRWTGAPDQHTTTEGYWKTQKTLIELELDELKTWDNIPEIGRDVSGIGFYSTTFAWDSSVADGAFLDLGPVVQTVTVKVNGQKTKDININKAIVDISPFLTDGTNALEITAATGLANRQLANRYGNFNPGVVTGANGGYTYSFPDHVRRYFSNGLPQAVLIPYADLEIDLAKEIIPVTGIKINSAATTTVRKNKTLQLGVIYTPADANDGTGITWKSSNEASVKVDAETGLITGVKAGGSARVTATSSNGKTYTITVTVDS